MKIHQLSIDDALQSVRSRSHGLASEEAERRLGEFGPNIVEKAPRARLASIIIRDFGHFFAVVLWFSAGLAFVAEWNDPGHGMAKVGYAVVIVILVSGAFSFWQERRVERTLAALQQLLPRTITVLRNQVPVEVAVERLVPGDVILVEEGDRIPADCRLIESYALRVNNSTITGESMPKARNADLCLEEELLRSSNVLMAGTSLVSGKGRAVVFATGMDTEFGKIAHLSQSGAEAVSPLRKELAHLSRLIVLLAICIGASIFAAGTLAGMPLWQDVIFSIGIFVAMVPEGLLPTLTLALVLAAQRMVKRNVLIRHLPSVETLGSTTVICTDKTGTLTENRMRVLELMLGLEPVAVGKLGQTSQLVASNREFFQAVRRCHSLTEPSPHEGGDTLLGDPMEVALVEMARRLLPASAEPRRCGEAPFDSRRMRQSVVFETLEGLVLYSKGALETILPLCAELWTSAGRETLAAETRERIFSAQEDMAERGLRVLALAARRLPGGCRLPEDLQALEADLTFLGLAGLEDPPRPEVPDAVTRCQEAGIKVIMVTGDHPRTAAAIARKIGLIRSANPRIITGEELRRLSDTQLRLALEEPEIHFARLAAVQKMRIVNALKKKDHVVAVTGDGVNDAPAFRAAHIGIAMGRSGADVAKESADMVLLDDNFASIVNAVEEGRAIFQNIRKFLTYVLVHNVAELAPYLAFALFKIPLPLTPIQILAVDMGTDTLTALGLGVESPDPGVMRQPPRPREERLLNRALALRAYLFLGVIEATAVMSAYFFVLGKGEWSYGQALAPDDLLYSQATTASLGAIIMMQIVNVFLCRSEVRPVWAMPLLGNRLIAWGVVLELAFLVFFVHTPWGNALLETSPLPSEVWLFLLPFAAGMFVLEEGRKWLVGKLRRKGPLGG